MAEVQTENSTVASVRQVLSADWPRMLRRSSFWLALTVFVVMAAGGFILWLRLDSLYRNRVEDSLIGQTERVATQPALIRAWSQEGDALNEALRQLAGVTGARLTAFDRNGRVLADSHGVTFPRPDGLEGEVRAALTGLTGRDRRPDVDGQPMFYVAVPVLKNGLVMGALRAAFPLQAAEAAIRQARTLLAAIWLAVALFVGAILLIQAERSGRSLRKLTGMIERITRGDLNARVLILRRDEIGNLGTALNEMADKLQRQSKKRSREKDRLNTVMHIMTDGVMILDSAGDVRLINPAAARLLRTTRSAALRRSFVQVTRDHRVAEVWLRCRETGAEQSGTVEMPNDLFAHVIVTPLLKRTRGGYLVLLQDLTQLRRLQTMRQDFVSNVSHELRTPLASLHALAETLRDGAMDDPPAAARFLDRIEVEVDALTQMVEELLELSRIESGQMPMQLEPVAVGDVLMPAVERLSAQAERAHIVLKVELSDDLPRVLVDRRRVQQVVTNLVHNAIKFSPSGGDVTIRARARSPYVEITVHDTGIGISREELPRVFERFYKTDRSRSFGGTGLGLAIAKHVVQAHGGEIWANSVEGEWSVFGFTLLDADAASHSEEGLAVLQS